MDKSILERAALARKRLRRSGTVQALGAGAAIQRALQLRPAARSSVVASAVKLQMKPSDVIAKADAARKRLRRG